MKALKTLMVHFLVLTLEATIQKELEKILNVGIIFPVKYSDWISNLVHVRKSIGQIRLCVDFRALNRANIKYHFPLPNMEIILQQVVGSQKMSLMVFLLIIKSR
jgi:hypothetical protein